MPFGGDFDEIYRQIYVPALESVGLTPLRADEIYNNRPIAQDIHHSIHNAQVILADVTGKNPNVNYELGAAHALGKEVIITTANGNDVPSDYRHIKYIEYHRGEIDWNRKFFNKIQKTLETVLARLQDTEADSAYFQPVFEPPMPADIFAFEEEEQELSTLEQAEEKGFDMGFFRAAQDRLVYQDCSVRIDVREGGSGAGWVPEAYLLNERVRGLAAKLPNGHFLKMRWVFIDNYASHGFGVDYIYNTGSLPIFAEEELFKALSYELEGQVFKPRIRYLEESVFSDDFDPNASKYYSHEALPEERHPISWRNGCYIAKIEKIHSHNKAGHTFYCLKEHLPLSLIGAKTYAPGEEHWLADWGQTEARCATGDLVSFEVNKVYELQNWNHTSNAHNVKFSDLRIVSK